MNQTFEYTFLNGKRDDDGDGAKGGRSPLSLEVVADRSTRPRVENLLADLGFTYEGAWVEEKGGAHRLCATIQEADQGEAIRLGHGLEALGLSETPKADHAGGYPATSY
ncbi:hypothetical protein GCM10023195_22850 [Actinoallomurus liliacearum]|uniref:Uncharacterized protein n=1 Tax=Actinoallomurus liliacearum TaxID=1080073 RepID=A0ABP8TEP6_9ACTN